MFTSLKYQFPIMLPSIVGVKVKLRFDIALILGWGEVRCHKKVLVGDEFALRPQ